MSAVLLAMACWAWGAAHRPPRRRAEGPDDRPRRGTRRRRPATGADWARLLDLVAAHVRGGDSLRVALAAAQHELPLSGTVVTPSTRLEDLETAATRDADEAVVVHVVGTAARLGGVAAATLHAGAAVLRERAAVRDDAAAHSAQARLSARVLTAVPLVFAAWGCLASAAFRHALATPAGATLVGTGLACNVLGWWWMRRIVGRATR